MRSWLIALTLLAGCSTVSGNSSPPATGEGDGGASDGGSLDGGGSGGPKLTFAFTPTALPATDDDLTNPLRGQYAWLGTDPYPAGWKDVDSYQRWSWTQFEPTHGNYNWKLIDDQIKAAKARHGRFGMRLMALCQGCADHTYKNAHSSIPNDLADVVNPLIGSAPGEAEKYLIPDWNSEAYFTRLGEVLTAISQRYHDEPHFAWVDVSSYGNWGEMHLYPFDRPGGAYENATQKPMTAENMKRLVALNASAFSNKLLVVNSEGPTVLGAAMASTSPRIGFRVDCLGSDGLAGGDAIDDVPGARDHWKVAPFITEWCQYNLGQSGKNLFVQGEEQVRNYHVSMLSSGNFTTNPTTQAEKDAFRKANIEAGYRLRPVSVHLEIDSSDTGHARIDVSWTNDNVAPTYLEWKVVVGFAQGDTRVEAPLSFDLRTVLPGAPTSGSETLTLPTSLHAGTYDVYVRVDDVQAVSDPMNLAITGRDASGGYPIGSITLP